jgi:putative oxidoreductase
VVLQVVIVFAVRLLLVALFLPFSALDKLLEFDAAVGQAKEALSSRSLAIAAIAAGFAIEVGMSLAVLTGFHDRLAALVLAGYCAATALLWKAFWRPGDFWARGTSHARSLFWDFLKNFAVAGGFLLITFGTDATSVDRFLDHPMSSTHPYALSSR